MNLFAPVTMALCGALAVLASSSVNAASAGRHAIEPKVPAKLVDVVENVSPADVELTGWLGDRVLKNERVRLVNVDLEPLLAGYRKKPGTHPWIGEHIGKWMHAATLAWAYTGDAALRQKLDYAASELIKAQEPDGYLGTYTPDKRFGLFKGADWDVWSHKYCLIGLLTYHQHTGDEASLAAARKAADLLINTFGPGKKSINSAGTHVGMAATSVLEPIVLLYRATGEQRYLDFGRYIISAWGEPNGAHIIEALLTAKQVNKTANAKAYEMLSNLVGLCELARATGDRDLLTPVLNAWGDIVANRLYITGATSSYEHFQNDHALPNQGGANVGETCVSTTWIQLNAQLLRLTGEARFATELERVYYNHLASAQRPDGAQWCYYTPLEGTKPYGPGINCCVSSGPRGMALLPQQSWSLQRGHDGGSDTVFASFVEDSRATLSVNGRDVTIEESSAFPRSGKLSFVVKRGGGKFSLAVRQPTWASPLRLRTKGSSEVRDGWVVLPAKEWKQGDRVEFDLEVTGKLVLDEKGNPGKAALTWGPFVLAYDAKMNARGAAPNRVAVAEGTLPKLVSAKNEALQFEALVRSSSSPKPTKATFIPFADAGATGSRFQVWLRGSGAPLADPNLLSSGASESRSRHGNLEGSIADEDVTTIAVTFDNKRAEQDWFAVKFDEPVDVGRVVFVHGRKFHDGGWFDTSNGKPAIEIKADKNAAWEKVAELGSYPATTATDSKGLREAQTFEAKLPSPKRAVAVRVIGRPASGDNPKQAFSSCAELQVFRN